MTDELENEIDPDEGAPALPLIAYRTEGGVAPDLVPAAAARRWMDETSYGFARRCLPLSIANQAGWCLLGTHSFVATWDGRTAQEGLDIQFTSGAAPFPVVSHFGHGILTFRIPYLFRTPPGWNLLVRGPANWPVAGVAPLEGIVETDWAVATFTMNWQMTTPGVTVEFRAGEPFCQLVPQRRGELERFQPQVRDLGADSELQIAYTIWRHDRAAFIEDLRHPGTPAQRVGWQRHYFQGRAPDGTIAPEHQTRLSLASPGDASPDPAADEDTREPVGEP